MQQAAGTNAEQRVKATDESTEQRVETRSVPEMKLTECHGGISGLEGRDQSEARGRVPVPQWLEHCVSSAKVLGLIPREHTY